MGFVYKVTNVVNGKSYIGITRTSVKWRWNAHLCASFNESYNDYNVIFHRAIRKYGIDSFVVETLCESENDLLKELECQYIETYGTLSPNGYNMTKGGDGRWVHDYDEIMDLWNRGYSQGEILHLYSKPISRKALTKILRSQGISGSDIYERSNAAIARSKIKRVYQYDGNTGKYIKTFYSADEASAEVGVSRHNIAQAARGSVKSSGGFQWSYTKSERIKPKVAKRSGSHLIGRYDIDGTLEEMYTSLAAAATHNGLSSRKLSIVCDENGTYDGKTWKYINTEGGIIHVK